MVTKQHKIKKKTFELNFVEFIIKRQTNEKL